MGVADLGWAAWTGLLRLAEGDGCHLLLIRPGALDLMLVLLRQQVRRGAGCGARPTEGGEDGGGRVVLPWRRSGRGVPLQAIEEGAAAGGEGEGAAVRLLGLGRGLRERLVIRFRV